MVLGKNKYIFIRFAILSEKTMKTSTLFMASAAEAAH